ncbi:MAG: collagenase-like protease [Bacillota bacterium]|nr:MAG: collagenase-like protease [Bacillota bacterium]
MDRVELLSPAGDLERLKITLLYGADAVYIGGQEYSLRANATNFSIDEIKEGCEFAHKLGKKVYLTLNIVFHNEDLDGVYDYIAQVVDAGIDAFIVSDVMLISYLVEHYPSVEVHVSTQESTTNLKSVQFFADQGVKRVVLARELSVSEIAEIHASCPVDLEVFIHGAMCTFYSGRCVLSNYLTNRDSNRGGCAQICRFAFDIDHHDQKFTMATKDLNMSHHVQELIKAGVKSLKVEGRMRSPYYLATVIGCYRKLIDAYYENRLTDDLMEEMEKTLSRVANRATSTHYYFHEADMSDQYYTGRQEASNQDYLAYVLGYDVEKKQVKISQRNYFKVSDSVEFIMPNGNVVSYTIKEILDEDGNSVEIANHPEQILYLPIEEEILESSMMRVPVSKE